MQTEHNLEDWLRLHGMTASELLDALDLVKDSTQEARENIVGRSRKIHIQQTEALGWIERSIQEFIPDVPLGILRNVPILKQRDEMEFPCVTFDGSGTTPIIYCNFDGSVEDLLTLAHECGHAAQFMMAKVNFIPPVWRETAAFLFELCIVEWLKQEAHEIWPQISCEAADRDKEYLGAVLRKLTKKLGFTSSAYYYQANYPPARVFAYTLFQERNQEGIAQVMHGNSILKYFLSGGGRDA